MGNIETKSCEEKIGQQRIRLTFDTLKILSFF